MSYKAWRISFQSGEQAARAAYKDAEISKQRIAELEAENKKLKSTYTASAVRMLEKQHAKDQAELAALQKDNVKGDSMMPANPKQPKQAKQAKQPKPSSFIRPRLIAIDGRKYEEVQPIISQPSNSITSKPRPCQGCVAANNISLCNKLPSTCISRKTIFIQA